MYYIQRYVTETRVYRKKYIILLKLIITSSYGREKKQLVHIYNNLILIIALFAVIAYGYIEYEFLVIVYVCIGEHCYIILRNNRYIMKSREQQTIGISCLLQPIYCNILL